MDRAGNVWVSHQEGLFRLFQQQVAERIPWAQLERREPATSLLYHAATDGLWLGFRDGGVANFKEGRIRASYGAAEGLGPGMVRYFYSDGNKTIWTATRKALSRLMPIPIANIYYLLCYAWSEIELDRVLRAERRSNRTKRQRLLLNKKPSSRKELL